jgi:hypothetical protein
VHFPSKANRHFLKLVIMSKRDAPVVAKSIFSKTKSQSDFETYLDFFVGAQCLRLNGE